MTDFESFPKIARLSREIIVTEKIDGTNAQILISDEGEMRVGSRNRWIGPEDDAFGFAQWALDHREELIAELGPGRHFGEWWGGKIQRSYGLSERRFSLFNVSRWGEQRPACCHVVPVLWRGIFNTAAIEACLEDLRVNGSAAAPGFMRPEGVIAFHVAGNFGLKKTLERDEEPKILAVRRDRDGGGEAGQTAKQAGPGGQQPGPNVDSASPNSEPNPPEQVDP